MARNEKIYEEPFRYMKFPILLQSDINLVVPDDKIALRCNESPTK